MQVERQTVTVSLRRQFLIAPDRLLSFKENKHQDVSSIFNFVSASLKWKQIPVPPKKKIYIYNNNNFHGKQ